jgi:hypothetical protein
VTIAEEAEEAFTHAQMWKGERAGRWVRVWGKVLANAEAVAE